MKAHHIIAIILLALLAGMTITTIALASISAFLSTT